MKKLLEEKIKKIRMIFTWLILASGCLLFWSGTLVAKENESSVLFQRIGEIELTAKQQHYLSTLKTYEQYVHHELIVINSEALDQETIQIPVNATVAFNVTNEKLIERGADQISWSGSIDGFERSTVTIVRNGNMVSANIRVAGDLYSIWPLGEGVYALTYEDGSQFKDHNEDEYKSLPTYDMQKGWQESHKDDGTIERHIPGVSDVEDMAFRAAGDCKIRLLVAFTDDVEAANADPRGQIQLAIDNYNNSSSNSEVNYDVEVARIVEVGYAESGVFSTDRNRFRNTSDTYMDQIHDLRELYDADYCQLVVQSVNSGEGCGLAYGIGVTYADAFCASKYSCIAGNLTFAHEYAHLHGCRHDTYVDGTSTPYSYGHGHVNLTDQWRTVMSYNNFCEDNASSCTRIQWWSTPDINVSSGWGGGPAGVAGTSKNEAVLDNTEATVSGWEALVTNKSVYDSDIIYADEEGNFEGLTTLSTVSTASTYLDYRNGSKGVLRAGSSITLLPGFWARSGSEVTAYLDNCTVVTAQGGGSNREMSPSVPDVVDRLVEMKVAPNPFSGSFPITLTIAEIDLIDTRISIIDLQGREVANVLEGETFSKGMHQLNFDTSELASGVYMLQMISGDYKLFERVLKTY